jgi:hypothetical protein
MIISSSCDGVPTVVLENDRLRVEVAPDIGGRIISLRHLNSGREFLWRNPRLTLQRVPPGSNYDANFYGGMDELLPTDLPETINGVDCADHGELWTLPLTLSPSLEAGVNGLILSGRLPLFGLDYERRMRLEENYLICDYRISLTPATPERQFMWKLHAALALKPGDKIISPADTARVCDPAWSRRKLTTPFAWPDADGLDMSLVPEPDGSTEFLYLYNLTDGRMALESKNCDSIECYFDRRVFPCCLYFASYGGMEGVCAGSFVGVLEPCTTMPISVNKAAHDGCCARLHPGDVLATTVIWAVHVYDHQT